MPWMKSIVVEFSETGGSLKLQPLIIENVSVLFSEVFRCLQ